MRLVGVFGNAPDKRNGIQRGCNEELLPRLDVQSDANCDFAKAVKKLLVRKLGNGGHILLFRSGILFFIVGAARPKCKSMPGGALSGWTIALVRLVWLFVKGRDEVPG